MPAHAVVAEPREELEDWVVGPQLAALREAADGQDVSVEAPCVALVASVFGGVSSLQGGGSQLWAVDSAPMTLYAKKKPQLDFLSFRARRRRASAAQI